MTDIRQIGSTNYIKRFAICACVTVFMEDTYSAMGMGTDLFNKKAIPGERLPMSKIDLWPPGHGPKVYKIPRKIDTFLFSPFIESTAESYDMGDGIRQSFRLRGPKLIKLGLAKKVPSPTLKEWSEELKIMDKKIDSVWPNINKILIFYDHSRSPNIEAGKRLDLWDQTAADILGWPALPIIFAPDETKIGDEKFWGWEHYTQATRQLLLNRIMEVEAR